MSELRKAFKKKGWKDCCGSFCNDCNIANAYRDKFGKKNGEKKFNKDFKKQGK